MRVSRKEMEKSHERIVASSARIIREQGIENTSVADVMSDAGMTHGGFYRHFSAKEELVLAGLQAALDGLLADLDQRLTLQSPPAAVEEFHDHYLSAGHVENPGIGCPVAALAGDVVRASKPLKQAFGHGVRQIVQRLSLGKEGSEEDRHKAAFRELALLAGSVILARASDPETAEQVLAACR